MLLNEHTALFTDRVSLVPYSKHHVPQYHEWMKDPDIRDATASEQLTLEEEYEMQQTWQRDSDKLTFIICTRSESSNDAAAAAAATISTGQNDVNTMIGDVNMFLSEVPLDDGEIPVGVGLDYHLVGELEVMIAEKNQHRKGYGRAALLMLMRYVLLNYNVIANEYRGQHRSPVLGFKYTPVLNRFFVKIGKDNAGSIALFESLGFKKFSETPNHFGEFELRSHRIGLGEIDDWLREHRCGNCEEVKYEYKGGEGGSEYNLRSRTVGT